ncbi:MAG: fluoride efflux transporter CrcB [Planctomycetes bacterium]|nr:fluoride efflux transporter CrcB [Planctomycetota bacterium]
MTWTAVLLVALGSAIGGVARFALGEWWAFRAETGFPWATIVINVSGSFLIGLAFGLSERAWVRQFVAVGLLGGYTTFSSFSLQTLQLVHEQRFGAACANVGVSVACCLIAVWLGYALAKLIAPQALTSA